MQGMSSDKPEVIELLEVMTGLAKTCKQPLSAQVAENMILGMQGYRSDKVKMMENKKKNEKSK